MPNLRVLTNFTRGADVVPLSRARVVHETLYSDPLWSVPPNPPPPVSQAELAAAIAQYSVAKSLGSQAGPVNTAEKNDGRKTLEGLLRQLAVYVQANHGHDLTKLLSSGFEAASRNNAPSTLAVPNILGVVNRGTEQLVLRVEAMANVRMYEVRYALRETDGTLGPWQYGAFSTNSRAIPVTGLTPGRSYQLQVRALGGRAGASDWSNPTSHMSM